MIGKILHSAWGAILLMVLTCPLHSQDLAQIQAWGSGLRTVITNELGTGSTGVDWEDRRGVGDFCDLVFTPLEHSPGDPIYHPLVLPHTRCFLRSFLVQSWDEMISSMDAPAPQTAAVRVYSTYSSGVIVEAWLDDGLGGLNPFRVAVDFTDMIFQINEQISPPPCVTSADMSARIDAIADRLDAYCVTHIHIDHWSWRLIAAMVQRNKPVLVTLEMLSALATMFPVLPPNVIGITTGHWVLNSQIDLKVYAGSQFANENNVYFFGFDVPVDSNAVHDGVTFIHFGDNDNPGVTGFVASDVVGSGWIREHVVVANYKPNDPVMDQLLDPDTRVQTPNIELFHFANPGTSYGMQIPPESHFDPAVRVPLFWGEGWWCPSDLP